MYKYQHIYIDNYLGSLFPQCALLRPFYLRQIFADNLSCELIQFSNLSDKAISLGDETLNADKKHLLPAEHTANIDGIKDKTK